MATDSRSDLEMHSPPIPSQRPMPTDSMQGNENGSSPTSSPPREGADTVHRSGYPGVPSYYPPPPPYHNPVYDDTPSCRRRYCRGICLCRIAVILIIVTLFFSILSFCLDVIFRPEHPSVSIASASVFSFIANSSSSTVSSDFSLTLSIRNPNLHMDISYLDVNAGVTYGFEFIAVRPQANFFQAAGAVTTKVVRVIAVGVPVISSTIKGLDDDMANGGVVEVGVTIDGLMKFSKIMWFKKALVVSCPDVKIQLVNGTTRTRGFMVGPPMRCRVSEGS